MTEGLKGVRNRTQNGEEWYGAARLVGIRYDLSKYGIVQVAASLGASAAAILCWRIEAASIKLRRHANDVRRAYTDAFHAADHYNLEPLIAVARS